MNLKQLGRWARCQILDFTLVVILSWLFYQLVIAPNGLRLLLQLSSLESQQQSLLEHIQQENKALERQYQLLRTNDLFLEVEARQEWQYVKPYEEHIDLAKWQQEE